MYLYRITKAAYANDLSGNGARLYGGRWNSEGLPALYTSTTRALAVLETLAHTPLDLLLQGDFLLLGIFVPDDAPAISIKPEEIPDNWDLLGTRSRGDRLLLSQQHLVLEVPSILVPEESNRLLNPLHPRMRDVYLHNSRPVRWDKRLLSPA
ncbi:MAG TPA: RES family NAD+ phosphorylase [Lacibacter sp.]|nr:RES family NAD+ phosphorylase [Lacibacter sp.]HMO89079.1 RES family NAD+ phosphorylase [Lacibacter sp.]HMP86370.1 RES family NAD+ phosphorylase [Lacibacter sp.]